MVLTHTNSQATANLPAATKGSAEAYLIEYQSTPQKSEPRLWTFQYNPQKLKYSREAHYSQFPTLAASVEEAQYGYSSGKTLTISDIYLDTFCLGKTVRPLLEGLQTLSQADVKNNVFNPKILSFVFGAGRFAPCVLTKIDWDESGWLSGEPARLMLNMSFLEVPKLDTGTVAKNQANQLTPTPNAEGKPRVPLTDRQKEDGIKKAKDWLNSNIGKLDTGVQNSVRSNSYSLSTNATTGDITMTAVTGVHATGPGKAAIGSLAGFGVTGTGVSVSSKVIGTVGRWDGSIFLTDKINTIPTLSTTK